MRPRLVVADYLTFCSLGVAVAGIVVAVMDVAVVAVTITVAVVVYTGITRQTKRRLALGDATERIRETVAETRSTCSMRTLLRKRRTIITFGNIN